MLCDLTEASGCYKHSVVHIARVRSNTVVWFHLNLMIFMFHLKESQRRYARLSTVLDTKLRWHLHPSHGVATCLHFLIVTHRAGPGPFAVLGGFENSIIHSPVDVDSSDLFSSKVSTGIQSCLDCLPTLFGLYPSCFAPAYLLLETTVFFYFLFLFSDTPVTFNSWKQGCLFLNMFRKHAPR